MAFASSVALHTTRPWNGTLCAGRSAAARLPLPQRARARLAPRMTAAAGEAPPAVPHALVGFLEDAHALGTMRFIAIANGAVLETVGRFDYSKKQFTNPRSGDRYLSIASPEQTFELHLNLTTLARVTMHDENSKRGGHRIYVIRLWKAVASAGEDEQLALSCMLQWDPVQGVGSYFPGAVDEFKSLMAKYGDDFSL